MNAPHAPEDCDLCRAVNALKRHDELEEQKYFRSLLRGALDVVPPSPRATTTRDPFRFSEDDVLDAHLALKQIDRIPSEWRA